MENIIDIIKKEVINRSNEFEKQTKGTKDEYNLYEEHVKYVYKYVCILSKEKNVDHEVLELSALLHDISMTDSTLDKARHNEYGAKMAEELLVNLNYPKEKIEFVKKCILNHSNKRASFRTTSEEQILVDADGLSHFDAIYSLYTLAHDVKGLNDEDSIKYIQEKLTKDYNEISVELRHLIEEKYKRVMAAKSIKDLLDIIFVCRKINSNEMNKLYNLAPNKDLWDKYYSLRQQQYTNNELDIYVIEINDQVIGEITVNYISHDLDSETIPNKRVYFEAFRLDKKYRGIGLGQYLMSYAMNELENKGYKEFTIGVEDDNEVAKHIYFKYGFTEAIDRGHGNEFDPSSYTLYMRSGRNK